MRSIVNKTSTRKHSKLDNPAYSTQTLMRPLGTAVRATVKELVSEILLDIWVKTKQECKEKGKQARKTFQLGRCLRVMASKSSQQITGSLQSYHMKAVEPSGLDFIFSERLVEKIIVK